MAIDGLEAAKYKQGTEVVFNLENLCYVPEEIVIKGVKVTREDIRKELLDMGFKDGEVYKVSPYIISGNSTVFELEVAGKKVLIGSYLFDKISM